MTDVCDICGKPIRKKDKPVEEMMVVEGTAVHFTMHEACNKGLEWYLELKRLCKKGKRSKRPLRGQKKLVGEEG